MSAILPEPGAARAHAPVQPSHRERGRGSSRTRLHAIDDALLRKTFGVEHLRPGQREVIESVLQGADTLAIMPTGAGKSLCYQLPALKIPGTTVVVSPLISLMKDQAAKLEEAGVASTAVNSTLSTSEEASALASIERADKEFIFATPERMTDPDFLATLREGGVSLFVIDEAHCISQWGHDFRPAYLQLSAAIAALGDPPVLALTATANEEVVQDIVKQLGRPGMHVVNTGVYRHNLHYRVVPVTSEEEKLDRLLELVRGTPGAGIVYAATVKAAEEVHRMLKLAGESATFYHGQLPARTRNENQDLFMQGECRVMVATNAFGMGIDKQDIRFVIHYQLPSSLEAYYQESGRAGRDGKPAECVLLYLPRDRQIQQFFLARRYPGSDDIEAIYDAMKSLSAQQPEAPFDRLQEALEDIPAGRLRVALKLLADGGFIVQDESLSYRRTEMRATRKQLNALAGQYRARGERDHEALERMVFYAQTGFCRWQVILQYFGEEADQPHCGVCDNCLQPPEQLLSPMHARDERQPHRPAHAEHDDGLVAGTSVTVAKFGEGRVVSTAGDKVVISFPDSETRTFLRGYVHPAQATS